MTWTINRTAIYEQIEQAISTIENTPVPTDLVDAILANDDLDPDDKSEMLDLVHGAWLASGIATLIGLHFLDEPQAYVEREA